MLREIVPPTVCPSCSGELAFVRDILYCHNSHCSAQKAKKIEHFAKTLKIKGLGPAAIEKLGLKDFDEIYSLSLEETIYCLGSEKLGQKLYNEIWNSASAPLDMVLPAFGIPLIGKTATMKLSETVQSITEITPDTCKRAGLGPKAIESLCDWLDKEFYCFYDGVLPFDYKFIPPSALPTSKVSGVVCITGKLKSFKTKAQAGTALVNLGYIIKSSLTKDVTILVNESGIESAKTKQARESGIEIITDLQSYLEKKYGTS
jgi:DNA ligase (NAD+)|tara:strand:- start:142 stop:921 length:780 start_codon:yes stop_codon:yes gene_type:complete